MFFFLPLTRYGAELVEVDSWSVHNWTVALAKRFSHGDPNFWLGFNTLDDLRTNTLDSPSGSLLSQYAGQSPRTKTKSQGAHKNRRAEWRNRIPIPT